MSPSCVFCGTVDAIRRHESGETGGAGPRSAYGLIAALPASIVVLAGDQFYRGYSLVIARTHATELYELPEGEGVQYYQDMVRTAAAIARAFSPRKMNYELLGNTVGHLHWHLFPRYEDDPNPLRPTWEHPHEPLRPGPEAHEETIAAIRRHLR